jgi:hypothetical protein
MDLADALPEPTVGGRLSVSPVTLSVAQSLQGFGSTAVNLSVESQAWSRVQAALAVHPDVQPEPT